MAFGESKIHQKQREQTTREPLQKKRQNENEVKER